MYLGVQCLLPTPQLWMQWILPQLAKRRPYDLNSIPDLCRASLDAHRLMHDGDNGDNDVDNDGSTVLLHFRTITAAKRGIFQICHINKKRPPPTVLQLGSGGFLYTHKHSPLSGLMGFPIETHHLTQSPSFDIWNLNDMDFSPHPAHPWHGCDILRQRRCCPPRREPLSDPGLIGISKRHDDLDWNWEPSILHVNRARHGTAQREDLSALSTADKPKSRNVAEPARAGFSFSLCVCKH